MHSDFEIQTATGQYWLDFVELKSQLAVARAEVIALQTTLARHQELSDGFFAMAIPLVKEGNLTALAEVLEQASIYPAEREAAKREAEKEAIRKQIAELQTKLEE